MAGSTLSSSSRPSVRHPTDLKNKFAAIDTQMADDEATIDDIDGGTSGYWGASEVVTSGAASVAARTTRVSVTGTQAYTLADGTFDGQIKTFLVTVAASTPDGTLTPAKRLGYASIDLDAVGETVTLQWNAAADAWAVTAIYGATVTP